MNLDAAYIALLKHPHDAWRAANQWLYCEIRDAIADRDGMTAEFIQDFFERKVAEEQAA